MLMITLVSSFWKLNWSTFLTKPKSVTKAVKINAKYNNIDLPQWSVLSSRHFNNHTIEMHNIYKEHIPFKLIQNTDDFCLYTENTNTVNAFNKSTSGSPTTVSSFLKKKLKLHLLLLGKTSGFVLRIIWNIQEWYWIWNLRGNITRNRQLKSVKSEWVFLKWLLKPGGALTFKRPWHSKGLISEQ